MTETDRQSPPLPSIDEVRREAFEEAAKVADSVEITVPHLRDAPAYIEARKQVAVAIRDLMRVDAPKGLDDG